MRKHCVEMVLQHLGDISARLEENIMAVYEYCPIPAIVYQDLEEELWCHNYYLAALCDEVKFPNWDVVGIIAFIMWLI